MAKALFHKNQKVFVKPVGTWAIVEQVLPQWVKGMDEPLRVHYDVGLGREFAANELTPEDKSSSSHSSGTDEFLLENWRVHRAKARWGADDDNSHHPQPGTFPVVVTDENDWGGWRVPGAEYDRDPHKIEYQARLIASSPQMLKLLKRLVDMVSDSPENTTAEIREIARTGVHVLRHIYDVPEELPSEAAE
tara:strand:- start:26469 stop:27041 length:573 start_codon:yes stop_codon:yes gene_type:complete